MRVIYLLLLSIASLPVFAVTLEQLQQQGHLVINYRFSPREQVIQYQPVTIEIEVATDRWFARGVRIDDLDIEGAVINHQGNLSTNSSRQQGGVTWAVQLWTVVIYPQKSGVLTIPTIGLFVSVNAGSEPPVEGKISLPEKTLDVEVPDAMMGVDQWWATTGLTVKQSFEGLKDSYQPGDAITHTIDMKIESVPAMMLPQLIPASIDGLAVYTRQPVVNDYNNRGVLKGARKQQFIYTVEQSGDFSLPAYQFYWWNLADMKKESIFLASQTFRASGDGIATVRADESLLDNMASIPWGVLAGGMSVWLVFWAGSLWLPIKRLRDFRVAWWSKKRLEQRFLDATKALNGELALQSLYDLLAQRQGREFVTLEQTFRDDKICAELVLQLKHFVYGSGSALTIAEAKQLLASINSKQVRVWPWQKRVDFSLNHRRVP